MTDILPALTGPDELLRLREAAQRLNISEGRLRQMIAEGRGPPLLHVRTGHESTAQTLRVPATMTIFLSDLYRWANAIGLPLWFGPPRTKHLKFTPPPVKPHRTRPLRRRGSPSADPDEIAPAGPPAGVFAAPTTLVRRTRRPNRRPVAPVLPPEPPDTDADPDFLTVQPIAKAEPPP